MTEQQSFVEDTSEVITAGLPPGTDVQVRYTNNLPAVRQPSSAIEGLEDLDPYQDITLGRWRLVQKMSDIEGEPGQWNNNLTEEIRDILELVVLKVSPSRAYFSDERKLVCSSRNTITSLNGKDCMTCVDKEWLDDGEQPPCGRGYTYVCWDPQDQALCLVGAMSTGVKSAKKYNGYLFHKRRPPFSISTVFTSHEEKGDKGTWEQLDITPGDTLSLDVLDEMRQMYRSLAGLTYQEVEEPEAAGFDYEQVQPTEEDLPF